MRAPASLWALSKAAVPAGSRGFAKQVATGLNIAKGGSDPELKPDGDYPEWLWKLTEAPKTVRELKEQLEEEGTLGVEEASRLVKLSNRNDIRERNSSKSM